MVDGGLRPYRIIYSMNVSFKPIILGYIYNIVIAVHYIVSMLPDRDWELSYCCLLCATVGKMSLILGKVWFGCFFTNIQGL